MLVAMGYGADVVVAGLLHDILEKTALTQAQISRRFGIEVALMVAANTNSERIHDSLDRYKDSIERCAAYGEGALLVRAADLIDNCDRLAALGSSARLERIAEKMKMLAKSCRDEVVDERMIEELNLGNLAGLNAERAEQNRLVDAAIAAQELSAWDALLKFEMERESKLRVLQFQVQSARETLTEQRRGLEVWLHNATNWTFILQQLGFFIVLLAGLIHQHDHTTMNAIHAAHAANSSSLASGDGAQQ